MRHRLSNNRLNRTSSHRAAMFANMSVSLVLNEQIKTTLPKARSLRPVVERLVTTARKGTLASRRRIIAKIRDKVAADKLMTTLSERYKTRPGGYTRIVKSGFRYGDRAPMAIIEFVDRDVNAKGSYTPKPEKDTQEDQTKVDNNG